MKPCQASKLARPYRKRLSSPRENSCPVQTTQAHERRVREPAIDCIINHILRSILYHSIPAGYKRENREQRAENREQRTENRPRAGSRRRQRPDNRKSRAELSRRTRTKSERNRGRTVGRADVILGNLKGSEVLFRFPSRFARSVGKRRADKPTGPCHTVREEHSAPTGGDGVGARSDAVSQAFVMRFGRE